MTTTPMNIATRREPHTQAGPYRRPLHLLLAAGGWVLFVHWWIVVIGRENPRLIQLTLAIIGVTLFACVVLTGLWTIHNLRLSKRKTRRTRMRRVPEDLLHDRLGRSVALEGTPAQLKNDPVVIIRMELDHKVYRPGSDVTDRAETRQASAGEGRLRAAR